MQPHTEGNMALPLQVGLSSRAALMSVDLAAAGATGPRDVFEGRFGLLRLFEGEWDLAPCLDALGRVWRITEVSHKPYPAGRATHAAIETVTALRDEVGFSVEDVASVALKVPSLIMLLASRPIVPAPTSFYAQLCIPFVIAKALLNGRVEVSDYRGAALTDPATHALAARVTLDCDDNPNPNALAPQTIEVRLTDGRVLSRTCDVMLAAPTRRLTRTQHLDKFRRCLDFAHAPLAPGADERLIELVDRLETLPDIRALPGVMTEARPDR